uniref:DUF4806 domain-containing protein n=2 Tax=Graphocephala atropunctata TaxID=36148 RepID=A0A1B6MH14_9HEMI
MMVSSKLDELSKEPSANASSNIFFIGDECDGSEDQFPFKTIDGFNEFEDQLKDKEYFLKTMQLLVKKAETSSVSKTARSILRYLLDVKLCQYFSLKGQFRKDQSTRKESFLNTNTSKLLTKCVESVWPKEVGVQKKVEATIATWFAQQASRISKKSQPNMEDAQVGEENHLEDGI